MPLARNLFLCFFLLVCLAPFTARADEKSDALWRAVRAGDLPTVKKLLDDGLDVNTKFRYGATALSYACDRNNVEIVKLLLDRGADVNVKDTFYGATPLSWAADKQNAEIVQLLLEKGAAGADQLLSDAVSSGSLALVKVLVQYGRLNPEALSLALAAAERDNKDEIVAFLRSAGAVPPPKADFQVDEETLKKYAGAYKADSGFSLTFTFQDRKLVAATEGRSPLPLGPVDRVTFRALASPEIVFVFNLDSAAVISVTLKQSGQETILKRIQ